MLQQKKDLLDAIVIVVAGAFFFLPFLGAVHLFDWDETNFAESAREMLVTGNYARVQIDYQPFFEKPPLFFWLQAASMKMFFVNEFAARFPNAVTGIITLVTFFLIGRKIYDRRFGFIWALCMLGSFLPHLYFKSGIIDPVFNYFIFLGIYFLILLVEKPPLHPGKYAVLSGIFIGLATLTKGPVALLILLLAIAVYWITVRFRKIISPKDLLLFIVSFFLIAGVWFIAVIMDNGMDFFRQFISYQVDLFLHPVAGHGEPFYYHFVVVLLGCFPMSIFALPALTRNYKEETPLHFKRWMLILFWVVMILFSVVTTKIVHYSSLTYFPLSFLAAKVIYDAIILKRKLPGWLLVILLLMGSIFSLVFFAVPWLADHKEILVPYVKDPFAAACLQTGVEWTGSEGLIGIFYLIFIISGFILLWRNQFGKGVLTIFGATACCMLIYLRLLVPKIEQYSQGPAIRFYEDLRGKKVYVNTFGFKSYAQYFYFRKPPGDDSLSRPENWLLQGDIDRPAYFVTKITSMASIEKYPDIRFLYREGGYAFYVREAKKVIGE